MVVIGSSSRFRQRCPTDRQRSARDSVDRSWVSSLLTFASASVKAGAMRGSSQWAVVSYCRSTPVVIPPTGPSSPEDEINMRLAV
jgi:hypothetical protein